MFEFPKALREALVKGRVVPFVGHGVSLAVQNQHGSPIVPVWSELFQRAALRWEEEMLGSGTNPLRRSMGSTFDFESQLRTAHSALGVHWNAFFQEHMDPPLDDLPIENFRVPRDVWQMSNGLVLTANYDQVLEHSCPDRSALRRVDSANVIDVLYSKRLPSEDWMVWHLYGACRTNDYILTVDGVRSVSRNPKEEEILKRNIQALRSILSGLWTVVFIGTEAPVSLAKQFFEGCRTAHYWICERSQRRWCEEMLNLRGVSCVQVLEFPSWGEFPHFIHELSVCRSGPESAAFTTRAVLRAPVPIETKQQRSHGDTKVWAHEPSPTISENVAPMEFPLIREAREVLPQRDSAMMPKYDLAIFVALRMERDVLVKHLQLRNEFPSSIWEGSQGRCRIALFCPDGMGRVAGAVSTMQFLRDHRPLMLVVAGIAGGFAQEGVSLGDVVVAKSVADLASRKIRQHEDAVIPEFRPREYATDSRISKLFQSGNFDRAKWEQRVIEQGEWPDGRRPTIHFGTVASVDEVVSSNEWVLKLRNAWPKLLGVEMEAGGVCAAAESFGLKVGVVRGISDHSDPAKSDTEWRRRAMKAVGTVVDELIKYNVPFSPE